MEKVNDNSKRKIILIIVGITLVLGILMIIIKLNNKPKIEQYYIDGKKYIETESAAVINNYSDYANLFNGKDEVFNLLKKVVNQDFFKNKSLIIVEDKSHSVNGVEGYISNISIKNNTANITIKRKEKDYGYVNGGTRTYFIPINNKHITKINKKLIYQIEVLDIINLLLMISPFVLLVASIIRYIKTKKKIKNSTIDDDGKKKGLRKALRVLIAKIIGSGIWGIILESIYVSSHNTIYKPIIYLYPEDDKDVSVKLGYKNKITVSYPKYTTGWNVFAKANGDLVDLNSNKNLYSLYYESKAVYNFKIEKDGFIIKGENTADFLEEKLTILGLNDREKEEFVIYWLPILQENKYNYIRFATISEIDKNMPLEINPNPDTLIRILMTFKKLERPIDIKEQQLITPERKGFVAVEWGGTEIK